MVRGVQHCGEECSTVGERSAALLERGVQHCDERSAALLVRGVQHCSERSAALW